MTSIGYGSPDFFQRQHRCVNLNGFTDFFEFDRFFKELNRWLQLWLQFKLETARLFFVLGGFQVVRWKCKKYWYNRCWAWNWLYVGNRFKHKLFLELHFSPHSQVPKGGDDTFDFWCRAKSPPHRHCRCSIRSMCWGENWKIVYHQTRKQNNKDGDTTIRWKFTIQFQQFPANELATKGWYMVILVLKNLGFHELQQVFCSSPANKRMCPENI